MISNDQIAAMAMKLAKAEGTVVWQRFVEKAHKQLETEAEANRPAPLASVSTAAELVKATQQADAKIEKMRINRCA